MELFSEVYGCYFSVVTKILNDAQNGLTKYEIERIIEADGFYDSAFHLLPLLFNEWDILEEKNGKYFSKISGKIERPITILERSWMKSLLEDSKINLFLDDTLKKDISDKLADTGPLFDLKNFHYYDKPSHGDDYTNTDYIKRFRLILDACNESTPVFIEYNSGKDHYTRRKYYPYKICYSSKDDKFRFLCAAFNDRRKSMERVTLNLSRIISVDAASVSDTEINMTDTIKDLYNEEVCTAPIMLEITKERNALERFMLQFASYKRKTEYDSERDIYTCRIYYDPQEETELLIRILSFGPVIKVIGPERFLDQVKERIKRQILFNENLSKNYTADIDFR